VSRADATGPFESRAFALERRAAADALLPLDEERERVFGLDPFFEEPERPDAVRERADALFPRLEDLGFCGDFCVFSAILTPPIDPWD